MKADESTQTEKSSTGAESLTLNDKQLLDAGVQTSHSYLTGGTEFQSQTESPISCDAAVQWEPLPPCDSNVKAVSIALDNSLGFDDRRLSHSVIKSRAEYLLNNGVACDDVETLSETHWGRIDQLRIGDTVSRLCGRSWQLEGHHRDYFSKTDEIVVQGVDARGYIHGRCPVSSEYGRVPIAEFLFKVKPEW